MVRSSLTMGYVIQPELEVKGFNAIAQVDINKAITSEMFIRLQVCICICKQKFSNYVEMHYSN